MWCVINFYYFILKQECIPIGCIPPVAVPLCGWVGVHLLLAFWHKWPSATSFREIGQYQKATYARRLVPKGQYQTPPQSRPPEADAPERIWDQTGSDIITPPPTTEQPSRYKNITFPQLRWRAVIISKCSLLTLMYVRLLYSSGSRDGSSSMELYVALCWWPRTWLRKNGANGTSTTIPWNTYSISYSRNFSNTSKC